MNDLERALADIRNMRSHLARGTEFRGLGPLALLSTSGFAIAGGLIQVRLFPGPVVQAEYWIAIWLSVAALAFLVLGIEMIVRARREHGGLADEMIRTAAGQLAPAQITGALIAYVLWVHASHALWMLPGLWQVLLALGLFGAARSLPSGFRLVAAWYLLCGLACLAFAQGSSAFSPWAMALPFALGQALAAVIIHRDKRLAERRADHVD